MLSWTLEIHYPERLTDAHHHLRELHADVEALAERYDAFVRTRQAATHSFAGYAAQIQSLRTRIVEALDRVEVLMRRQGHELESVAIEQLVARRDLLENYRNRARFAFADSYDRAAKSQTSAQVN